MEKPRTRNIIVYDAETYDNTKRGNISIPINLDEFDTPEKLDAEIARIRLERAHINEEYRKDHPSNKKALHVAPPKFVVEYESDVDIMFDETGPSQATFALLAASKAGKTTLISKIFKDYYNKKPFISVLYSDNSHIPLYRDFEIKIGESNDRTLKIIEVEHHINKNTDNKYSFFNVFDDVIDNRHKKIVDKSILTYRNANISTMLSTQYPKLLSVPVRSNINHIFFGRFNNDEPKEQVIAMWLKTHLRKMGAKTKDDQCLLYDKITVDHGFIYLCALTGEIKFIRLKL